MSDTSTNPMPCPSASSPQAIWEKTKIALRKNLGDAVFRSWIAPLSYENFDGQTLTLAIPTRFLKNWVATHYADHIKNIWRVEGGAPVFTVDFEVRATGNDKTNPSIVPAGVAIPAAINENLDPVTTPIENFSSPLDPRFTFDNFIVGKPNELAYAAAKRVAENDAVSFNPLFLYGGVGLGKTHLMHAIAWSIRARNPARKVIYLSAEKFMYQFIKALRFKDTMTFKEQFRSVDVLMIDDVQFIGGKESTQEEFFHTFNALVDQNRQIILSADKSPSDIEGLEERLRSRLGWGLVADIHPTSYELRLGILQSKREQLGHPVPADVLEFLAHRITSSVRELEGALNRVIAHSDLVGRPITLDGTMDVLRDLLRACDRRVTIEEIQKKVAEHYNIRVTDMHSARRLRAVARPRQVAMYLAKTLTAASLPEIGRKFGGRDHTTVIHGVRKVEELVIGDQGLHEDIEFLKRALG